MAISTYAELKSAITEWSFGASSQITPSVAETCIALSQALFNTRLRCREMLATTTLSPTSNVFTLPSDYAQWVRVVELVSPRRSLVQITEEDADIRYATRPAGPGQAFTIVGNSLTVYPLITNDISLTYYQRLSAFSSDSATDWLLTRYPHIYLCAGQMYAAEYMKDPEEFGKHAQALETYISMLGGQDNAATYANVGVSPYGLRP